MAKILKQIRKIDYDANYAYAPPTVSAMINIAEIISVVPVETRIVHEHCVRITMRNGQTIDAVASVEDFFYD